MKKFILPPSYSEKKEAQIVDRPLAEADVAEFLKKKSSSGIMTKEKSSSPYTKDIQNNSSNIVKSFLI